MAASSKTTVAQTLTARIDGIEKGLKKYKIPVHSSPQAMEGMFNFKANLKDILRVLKPWLANIRQLLKDYLGEPEIDELVRYLANLDEYWTECYNEQKALQAPPKTFWEKIKEIKGVFDKQKGHKKKMFRKFYKQRIDDVLAELRGMAGNISF